MRSALRNLLTIVVIAAFSGTASAATLGQVYDDGFDDAGTSAWRAIGLPPDPTVASLAAPVVRIDVRWPAIAATTPRSPRNPNSVGYDWRSVDRRMIAAATNGAAVLLSIGGTPEWARNDGGAGGSPGDPAWMPKRVAWRNFVFAVAERYSGTYGSPALPRASQFEIWPQPNLAASLRPQRIATRLVAPGLYRLLLTTAKAELAGVAAAGGYSATIVSGGLSRTDAAATVDTPALQFLRGLARTRVTFDAIGLRLSPPSGLEAAADPANLSLTDFTAVVTAIDTYWPGGGKTIWLTGYGVPSGPAEAGLSDGSQSAAVGAFLAAAANPRVGIAIWSGLKDTTAAPSAGLYRAAATGSLGSAKPAWSTWTGTTPPP